MIILFGCSYLLRHEFRELRKTPLNSPPPNVTDGGNLQPRPVRPFPHWDGIRPTQDLPRLRTLDFYPRSPVLHWTRLYDQSTFRRINQLQIATEWRRAVGNLIRDATLQMTEAKKQLVLLDTINAVLAASMAVEKMARALLHCYGIKPEPSYGQAEALRLLQAIAKENQNQNVQKSIDFVEKITALRTSAGALDHSRATQILKEATKPLSFTTK